jgi:antitoxin CptB
MTNENSLKIKKLQWQCRRGMLEVDLYLMHFLKHNFVDLSVAEQALFEVLLKESDPVLLSWLTGQEVPEKNEMIEMVQKVINARRDQSSV